MSDEANERPEPRRSSGIAGGFAASMLIHAVLAAILFLRLPSDPPQAEPEQVVSVEIVPEAEEAPEEPQPEEEQPEEEQQPPPPPEPEEADGEEQPPEPEPALPAAPQPEDVAPEEAPPEERPPEEAPPEDRQPQEDEQEPPPEAEAGQDRQPLQALRPVFEFGESDSGPRQSPEGGASRETGDPQGESGEEAYTPQEEGAEQQQADAEPQTLLDAAPDTEGLEASAPPADQPADADAAAQVTLPEPGMAAQRLGTLSEARTLFSQAETDDPVARTAMGAIPRDLRAGQLCATELREQLRNASPAFNPEILPSYRLPGGQVLDVHQGGFRAGGRWYDVSFRCELDADALRITSFAFQVGEEVPRSRWRARGFPEL